MHISSVVLCTLFMYISEFSFDISAFFVSIRVIYLTMLHSFTYKSLDPVLFQEIRFILLASLFENKEGVLFYSEEHGGLQLHKKKFESESTKPTFLRCIMTMNIVETR